MSGCIFVLNANALPTTDNIKAADKTILTFFIKKVFLKFAPTLLVVFGFPTLPIYKYRQANCRFKLTIVNID
jgi:hypothetical protein